MFTCYIRYVLDPENMDEFDKARVRHFNNIKSLPTPVNWYCLCCNNWRKTDINWGQVHTEYLKL